MSYLLMGLGVIIILLTAGYRIVMKRWPKKEFKTLLNSLWNQARRAPVLAGILVLIIVVWAWPSCDRQSDSSVAEASTAESQYREPHSGVPVPRAQTHEDIVNEWKQEGFQVVDRIVLLEGDTSRIYTFFFGEDYRFVGEAGKRLLVKRLQDADGLEMSNKDHYDLGDQPTSIVFIGLEPSTQVTILKRSR